MESELEVLKNFYAQKGRPVSVRGLSKQIDLGIDYIHFLCANLLRKNFIKKEGQDKFSINNNGQKELKKRGLIKLKNKRKKRLTNLPVIRTKTDIDKKNSNNLFNQTQTKGNKLPGGKKVEKAVIILRKIKGGPLKNYEKTKKDSSHYFYS